MRRIGRRSAACKGRKKISPPQFRPARRIIMQSDSPSTSCDIKIYALVI